MPGAKDDGKQRLSGIDDDELAEAYNRALALEKSGDMDGAQAAYARVLALDPQDHGGAAVRLASLGRGETPSRAPVKYVETLFDQTADVFEDILVERLGYHVPLLVKSMLEEHAPGPHERLLDLGCGTGLAAVALAGLTSHRTGIDLSANMVELAGQTELYQELYVGDAVEFVAATDAPAWDLVVATDVLPYLGDVNGLFAGIRRITADGGWLAFSTELLDGSAGGRTDFAVGPHHRFAHAADYIAGALREAGFEQRRTQEIVVRHEEGTPVAGQLVLAQA